MDFNALFLNLKIPVVVCESMSLKISYINTEAKALLYVKVNNKLSNLRDLVLPKFEADFNFLMQTLSHKGFVTDFLLELKNADFDDNTVYSQIRVNANMINLDKKYFCFYLSEAGEEFTNKVNLEGNLMKILSVAYHSTDIDLTINTILSLLGETLNVSRVYIYENINNKYTSNTYEWCARGVDSLMDSLLHIPFEDINYDELMSNTSIVICNDIREMDENDQRALQRQGVKALLCTPFFNENQPMGIIGCDECYDYRKWSKTEIDLLLNISVIVSSLVIRKNIQTTAETTVQIMERVIDNIEAMVYVVDKDNYKVIYMNKAMARERGIKDPEKEELYCYQMFLRDLDKPCDECINRQLFNESGKPVGTLHSEFKSTINNKWYSMSATAVEWINGEYVFLQSVSEITERKNNEDILKKSASMDAMTNVYNREWGYKSLDMLISNAKESDIANSIIFIDIDGLKYVNDNYGHIEGDKIIIGVIEAIKKCIRKNDIIFRWAGDEFVILLPGCTREKAELIMNKSNTVLDEINKEANKPYKYSFSYGIFETNKYDDYTPDSVIKTADSFMYKQKNSKKLAYSR